MRRFLLTCSVLLLTLSIVLSGLAIAQVGQIIVKGVPDRYKAGNKGESTYGLKTVGVGNRVVLVPRVVTTGTKYSDTLAAVTSAAWTLTGPTGSTATIQDTATGLNGKIVVFVPDVAGDYTVGMTATTVLGTTSSVSITVVASKFVGAGISLSASAVPSGCACHLANATNFTDWQKTKHAKAIKRRFDALTDNDVPDPAGGHFANYCMPCHSAGYYKSTVTGVPNSGYGEISSALKFNVVSPQHVGVFDSLVTAAASKDSLKTMLGLTGIQCENCHGPAYTHQTSGYPSPGNTKLDESLSSDVCSPCHFSSDRHGKGYAWSASAHANSMAEGAQIEYMDRPICSKCHTAQGYIGQTINGQAEPVVASGLKVYSNPQPIGCTACHDPHNNSKPSQLRAATVGDVCIGCHITRISTRGGLHTANQGSMLIGADAAPFTLQTVTNYLANSSLVSNVVGLWSGWELPGYKYENSSHSAIAERCVACHMADSPSFLAAQAANFSIADTMLNKLGGHTFNVAYTPAGATTPVLNPTGCTECHGTVSIDFVELTQAKTKALLTTLLGLLPKRDSVGAPIIETDTIVYQNWKGAPAGSRRKLTVMERAAAYNYVFVTNDGSFGVHNFNYAKGLLTSSIEQLQLGAGAANIVQIKDVPGDNGKFVQVVWGQFPSESYSFNRLTEYGIWRRDPMLPALSSSYLKANSFTEMIQKGIIGGMYSLAGNVWTYVGYVPASGFSQYSFIAPTIFDSTKVAGMKYTAFYVCGYTSDPTVVYKSAVDSGFSLNNLMPLAPTGFTAKSSSQGVDLSWDPATQRDNDVVQYEVYRSSTGNFDPTGMTPIGTVERVLNYRDAGVSQGSTYYYKIAAIDNAGNRGAYSNELAIKVTSVQQLSGLPTEYSLGQNYPNPFNPTTQIRFALPHESFVKLSVYSISGELVATLLNSNMSAGNYEVTWRGTNNVGQFVSSGVYVYRLQAGDFVSTKKMVLIK